jgi:hypothetical protein
VGKEVGETVKEATLE